MAICRSDRPRTAIYNFTPDLFEGEQVRAAPMPVSEADYTASAKD